jgi:two-component system response regulator HydG
MQAYLIIESGEGSPRECELSPDQPITLGRSRDNTITLQDEHTSRLHAKIYFQDGGWLVEDCGTLNGTRVNGERIQGPATLADHHQISIGDIRLRFSTEAPSSEPPSPNGAQPSSPDRSDPFSSPHLDESGRTALREDELAALSAFIMGGVEENEPRALVRRALATIAGQTGAAIVGFLSLDSDDPLPKLVVPETARVDIHLSRQLTRKVQSEGRPVWLGAGADNVARSDSLLPFHDAMCLPLLADGSPLGALHVYKGGRFFHERDLRFCEVVAGFLANRLGRLRNRRALEAENSRLRAHSPVSEKLIGDSEPLRKLRQLIARAAPRPSIVLILGESGSGKELVAQDLHRQSPRKDGPLVVLNCAAVAPTLVEAELFGHARGAFTSAFSDHPGLFQQADEGTLFLDEIGELSLDCQAKLLRVVEGKSFRPVGGTAEIRTDVRIIAATHRNLECSANEGKFRQDLYFRLNVIRIEVPPLRTHAEDIPALVEYFLSKLAIECGRRVSLTDAAVARLREYSWPGNVRQLRAVLESTLAMSETELIDADGLLLPLPTYMDYPASLNLQEVEAWAIRKALAQTGNNLGQAARLLGVVRETLREKRRKYKIGKEEKKDDG